MAVCIDGFALEICRKGSRPRQSSAVHLQTFIGRGTVVTCSKGTDLHRPSTRNVEVTVLRERRPDDGQGDRSVWCAPKWLSQLWTGLPPE